MPLYPDDVCREPCDDGSVAGRIDSPAPAGWARSQPPPVPARPAIECEVRDGLATVRGKGRAHYLTGSSGRQMLILERGLGERIRINSTTEVVILEIDAEHIRIAIETTPEG